MEKETTIQIRSRNFGNILFIYTKAGNTIKATLEEGLRQGFCFRGADLTGADLRGACLDNANFVGADFHNADLRDATFYGANLRGACFWNTNLGGVKFNDANLYGADFQCAINVPNFLPLACPSDGAFVGWKKVSEPGRKYLVKLLIPKDAKRSSANSRKCRCDKAKVLAITDLDGNNPIDEVVNRFYAKTVYKVGKMVYPDEFDANRWNECSHGIHFFINTQDAIDY